MVNSRKKVLSTIPELTEGGTTTTQLTNYGGSRA